MRQKGSAGLIILIILLVLVVGLAGAGYYVLIYPQKQLEKARTPDTSIKTDSGSLLQKSEIKEKGLNVLMTITPSKNDVISGVVTIKATDIPVEPKHVGFSINEKFEDLGQGGPNLGFDSDGVDGWKKILDTTEYENGTYFIALFVFENDASSNPLGVVNAQVEIRN